MKKILLVCLTLLLMQGVCLAKIEKQVDKFDGKYCYYVDYLHSVPAINGYIGSSFVIYFQNNNITTGNGFEITLRNNDTYALGNTIKMQIDDIIYTWTTEADSLRSNGSAIRAFPIPDNVYTALMKTQKNVAIRFYYSALSGDYMRDYVIPYKIIKEAQTMFATHVPKTETPTQPAK